MPRTAIRGNTQIKAGTVTNTEIDAAAGIELSKLVDGTDLVVAGAAASQAIDAGGFKIVNGAVGTDPTDFVTKGQLDSVSAGLDPKESCRAGSTVNIPTLSTLLTIDGIALANGDRVLVKDQDTASTNGIYIAGAASWARATDFNSAANVTGGAFTFLEAGTQAGTGWLVVADGTVDVGTDDIIFTEFTQGQVYTAGDAIDISANTISVKVDDTSIEISTDTLSVKALGIATGMLQDDAVDRTKINADVAGNGLVISTGGDIGALEVSVDGSSLEISANAVRAKAAGITESHLNTSVAGTGLNGGGGSALSIDDTVVVAIAKYLVSQSPAETPNDVIVTFTFNGGNPVVAGSEMIFLNGVLQEGGGNDYTFVASTGVATFVFTPSTGDKLRSTFLDV